MVESSLLLSKREAAQTLGVSVRTLENLIAFRELPVRRVGRRRLIERQALEKFAKRDHATKAQNKGRPFDLVTKSEAAGHQQERNITCTNGRTDVRTSEGYGRGTEEHRP